MQSGHERPIIGVNMHVIPEVRDRFGKLTNAELMVIQSGYLDPLWESGADVVLLPSSGEPLTAILDILDGLVMIGGDDYDPRLQGFQRTAWNTRVMPPRREDFDRRILNWAIQHRTPVLAIGAGMQLLNELCGGHLSFEIGEDFPRAMPHHEKGNMMRHNLDNSTICGFLRNVTPDECRSTSGITTHHIVGSQHHQAIDELAPNFTVIARTADKIIEAIESTDPEWFAIGVQFHPEAPTASEVERLVFRTWMEEVYTRSGCYAVA